MQSDNSTSNLLLHAKSDILQKWGNHLCPAIRKTWYILFLPYSQQTPFKLVKSKPLFTVVESPFHGGWILFS